MVQAVFHRQTGRTTVAAADSTSPAGPIAGIVSITGDLPTSLTSARHQTDRDVTRGAGAATGAIGYP
jgi:hypothetical protein